MREVDVVCLFLHCDVATTTHTQVIFKDDQGRFMETTTVCWNGVIEIFRTLQTLSAFMQLHAVDGRVYWFEMFRFLLSRLAHAVLPVDLYSVQ